MSGLINSIKSDVKKAGTNKSKFIYFRPDTKVRVRFLTDMDDGMEVTFHDSFQDGINVPCQEIFGRECPYCEDSRVRTRSQYIWSVWNYEAKEVQLFMFAVNNCSPIPALMAMYENYGTLIDRDYVISKSGKGPDTTYSVVPMDKQRFRNEKAKALSEKKILQMLDKAYPCDSVEDEDDYEEEKPKARKSSKAKKTPRYEEPDDDDYDDDQDWGDESDGDDEAPDYSELSPKELYQECLNREIKVEKRKSAKYYIKQLEDYDQAQDDWDDSDDEWEDEE